MSPRTAIVWFRRDLRLHDHPALHRAVAEFDRVACVFVLDGALLEGRYASAPRVRFMIGCLRELDSDLARRGGSLVVRRGRPEAELVDLARETGAEAVLWTSDVSPYARARDRRTTEALRAAGVAPLPHGGAYVIDPSKPRPSTVFSRFYKGAWQPAERREVLPAPERVPGAAPGTGVPEPADLGVGAGVPEPAREPGEAPARAALATWLGEGVDGYHERQEGMARISTSVLSPYLRWGCLSARECEHRAREHGGPGAAAWIRQLAWRDFYAHTLLTHPANVRTASRSASASSRPTTTPTGSRRGRRDVPGIRSSTPVCGSSRRAGGCTTGCAL